MKNLVNRTMCFMVFAAAALTFFSCSDDDGATEIEQDQKVTQAELKTILEVDELSGVADDVVTELFEADKSGKAAKLNNECYEATYTETGFTVTFADCSVESGENLDGSLSVVYGVEGSDYAFTVTYDNLMVDGIKIDGTRSFAISGNEEESSVSFIIASNMIITMTDGAVISEEGNKTIAIVFGEEFGDGALTIDGKWVVKADGNTYSVDVSKLLEAQFGCDYIGKGLMLLNKNGLEVSVDFGDGGCDDSASVIYPDGTTEDFTLDK